jgi:arylsulfatase A-like enzyme
LATARLLYGHYRCVLVGKAGRSERAASKDKQKEEKCSTVLVLACAIKQLIGMKSNREILESILPVYRQTKANLFLIMKNALLPTFLISCFSLAVAPIESAAEGSKPNIVYIICDDLGYGEIHTLAPKTSKIPTPGADRLASQGMVFTDAHSGSAVCTPTRYGIMTGRYSWRTRLQKGVVTGFAPSLIAENRPTVASFLKGQGYDTAIVGKWHLNFEYLDPKSGEAYNQKEHKIPPVGAQIPDGPLTRGFDFYHGFHHARNMKAVIENNRVIEHDDEINMLPRLTRRAVEYIDSRAGNEKPFFLYLPLGSPHNPIVPTPEWQGKSGLSPHADFVMQTDHVVVEVSKALERHGLTDNTLVIFTSDNGTSKAAGIAKLEALGHFPSAHLRGSKADLWDGGHRIPFIVRWPGKVEPGSQNDQLICLTDLLATTAGILETTMPKGSGEDSVSFLPALSGKPIVSTRNGVIHHSNSGHFAYRYGKWKLLLARGSGGWSSPTENEVEAGALEAQLYDMGNDVGETNNLYTEKPEVAERLLALLASDVNAGRSTKGALSLNDVADIVLWKSGQGPAKSKKAK